MKISAIPILVLAMGLGIAIPWPIARSAVDSSPETGQGDSAKFLAAPL